ncbi:hypothetical protein GGI16_000013 [Coemansia sp. S142-1]|nr:hypothetical protein GGI16_000013 [Coemansia sp. S142-1]
MNIKGNTDTKCPEKNKTTLEAQRHQDPNWSYTLCFMKRLQEPLVYNVRRLAAQAAQAVADIIASPNEYVERLVKARPVLDLEVEWERVYNMITRGANKQDEKKIASDKVKRKTKRTAKSSTT